ncbi:MAG: hypothetical protein L6Q46_09455 [Flavobacterium sp.]|uniref:hypothetical protein n=1 Tax=Flavobacterium sp. TaxID=239 RepID=UPI0025C6AC45|nr:hypothetical protein [Flavobacterium sp.]MCK6608511.1 hypothetical protein [Flavobacterium sp.]
MESLLKIEIRTLFLCSLFLMCSTINIRAQQIYNCNDTSFESNQKLKNKLTTVLNSTDLVQLESNQFSRNSNNSNRGTILDIRYENLNMINQLNALEISNLKYCILRIRNNIAPIDLVALNALINLELLHVIIETDYQSVFSVLNVNNPNLFITYQISVPQ